MAQKCLAAHPRVPQALCDLPLGHYGDHAGRVEWVQFPDDVDAHADTVQFPPIRETVRRRPPAPAVEALTERADLAEALLTERRRELAELRDRGDDE